MKIRTTVPVTGAKRVLGMTTAVAPGKQLIAAPIAVSSCRTCKKRVDALGEQGIVKIGSVVVE